jgi:hypothetical protein
MQSTVALLFTFALGTAAGDLVGEQFGLGYRARALIVDAIICARRAALRRQPQQCLHLLGRLRVDPPAWRIAGRSALAGS